MAFKDTILGASCLCQIGDVFCDAVVREVHSLEAETTDHTVESGATVSDHYRVLPRIYTVQAIISRTPLAVGFPGQSAVNSVKNLINGSDPVSAAWTAFSQYMNKAEKINIITGKEYYTSMVILSLQHPRENSNGWMVFDMTAKKMTTAFTDSTEALVAKKKEAAKEVAQDKKNKGNQPTKQAEQSILAGWIF